MELLRQTAGVIGHRFRMAVVGGLHRHQQRCVLSLWNGGGLSSGALPSLECPEAVAGRVAERAGVFRAPKRDRRRVARSLLPVG